MSDQWNVMPQQYIATLQPGNYIFNQPYTLGMGDVLSLGDTIVFSSWHQGPIEIIPKGTPCTIKAIDDLFFMADLTIDSKVYELSCYNRNLSLDLVKDESANNHMGGRRRRRRTHSRRLRTRRLRTRRS
jgi:hypothetical protein